MIDDYEADHAADVAGFMLVFAILMFLLFATSCAELVNAGSDGVNAIPPELLTALLTLVATLLAML